MIRPHEIIGTKVQLQTEKKGEQELEDWLRYMLSKNADFEYYDAEIDGQHVELIRMNCTPKVRQKTFGVQFCLRRNLLT